MATYYCLADINSAYVSFITLFNPHLINRPLGVLSSNQGNVIARNQMIKDLGVKMADPAYLAKPIVDKHNGHLFGSNFTFFGDMSNRFHTELEELLISPEIYSVDESFGILDTACMPDLKEYSIHIQATIKQNLGLDIGVGVGRSKTLAKLANWFCKEKKYLHITHGVTVLDTLEKEEWVLRRAHVSDIWGCGKKTSEKLVKHGIKTGLELRDADLKRLKTLCGITLERTVLELRGVNAIDLKASDAAREQICISRSMGIVVTLKSVLSESLSSHVNDAAFKLRKQGSWCKRLTVFIGTNPFKKSDQQYHNSISIELPRSTQSTAILTKYALFVLDRLFREGFNYRKTGVVLSDLEDTQQRQPDMFSAEDTNTFPLLDETLDKINAKFGSSSIRLASEGFSKKWRPRDDLAPPSYTTSLSDLPSAK